MSTAYDSPRPYPLPVAPASASVLGVSDWDMVDLATVNASAAHRIDAFALVEAIANDEARAAWKAQLGELFTEVP